MPQQSIDAVLARMRRLEGGGLRTFASDSPLVIERAAGAWLYSPDGRRYLDFAGSYAVTTTGHCHPRVVAAIRDQAEQLIHCSSAYPSPLRADFLEAIESICASVFPSMAIMPAMTGAMANEIALSLVRWLKPGSELISFTGSYFGRSVGAAPLAGKAQYRQALGLGPQAHFAPFPDPIKYGPKATDFTLSYLEAITAPGGGAGAIGGVIVEPIQGNAGVLIPPDDFLPRLRSFCDRVGALLIVDEIQCGCGRTGRMWAIEHTNVQPDLMTIGKGIVGNMGVAAVVGRPDLMKWKPDAYSSTFLTNHVALAAAVAAVAVIKEEGLVERSRDLGAVRLPKIESALAKTDHIASVRGRGLWFAFDVVDAQGHPDSKRASRISARLRDVGVIVGGGGSVGQVIKLAPPLNIPESELDAGLDEVIEALRIG